MDYKTHSSERFTCPKCGQEWVLSGGGPGQYWDKKEEREKEDAFATELFLKEYYNTKQKGGTKYANKSTSLPRTQE